MVCCAKVSYVLLSLNQLTGCAPPLARTHTGRQSDPPDPHLSLSPLHRFSLQERSQTVCRGSELFHRFRPGPSRRQWPLAVEGKLQKLHRAATQYSFLLLHQATRTFFPRAKKSATFCRPVENHQRKVNALLFSKYQQKITLHETQNSH